MFKVLDINNYLDLNNNYIHIYLFSTDINKYYRHKYLC